MMTVTKVYPDIPFAHRQHTHDSHCAYIHGHNWTIRVTFACRERDINGFVVDFGKLKYLKRWIDEVLDHACLINAEDRMGRKMAAEYANLFKTAILPDVSCEGIAEYVFDEFNRMVQEETQGRVWVKEVTVDEDSKNSATYRP